MTEKSIADSRHHLPADTPCQPSVKDMQGSDNTLPFSPQWLQPKSGDNKMGIEYHTSPHYAEHMRSFKGPGSGEDFYEVEKRKDIYKLASQDSETGCRGRWRDEERETISALRRDHRGERWPDKSMRHSGERRNSCERWNELGNRESSFDHRRESKWNTSWGPDDKESESSKDSEGQQEKIMSRLTNHGRDTDKEGDMHSRSWRSNSSMNRGKAEPSYPHPLTPHKQIHIPGYGRGKVENGAPLSPSGRGNYYSSHTSAGTPCPYHLGTLSSKSGLHTGSALLRYGRIKLLDIYMTTDLSNHRASVDGIIEVPSLIRSEPLEPLALSAPTIEESVVLKAIEKGEIASSGLPFKEGIVGKNTVDPVMLKQMKLGVYEDLPHIVSDFKIEGSGSSKLYHGGNPKIEPANHILEAHSKKTGYITEEMGIPENHFSRNAAPWRSQSEDISRCSSTDLKDNPAVFGDMSSEHSWSHLSEEAEIETRSASVSSSSFKNGSAWQNNQFSHVEYGTNPKIRRYPSDISNRERSDCLFLAQEDFLRSRVHPATRNFEPNPSPEELFLCYKDPHGQVQGPFSGSDLITWFEAGYFGIDLEVRPANAPLNAPFLLLGDVIPQLRLKFRPPPGFCAANPSEIQNLSERDKNRTTVLGTHSGIGYEPSKSMQRSDILVSTESDNRVLESLMSTNLNSSAVDSPSEGMHNRGVHCPGFALSLLEEAGNDVNYLLAQKRLLEQQHNSLPYALPFLSGSVSSPIAPSMGIISNSSEPVYQASQASQQLDLLSLLQVGQIDNPPSVAISSGAVVWSNHPDTQALNNNGHVIADISQNIDVHQNQNLSSQFGFVTQQQQQKQPHNLPSLSHLVNQPTNRSGIISPEQLLSSDITQDTQMLNMLAQYYLLSQPPMQSQVSLPSQFSLLNECFLLKQQLQQQQQQLLLQQHQLLLSQVFSGHQSSPHLGDPSQKLQSTLPAGKDVQTDHPLLRQDHDAYINQKLGQDNLHDGHKSTIQTVNSQDSKNIDNLSSCYEPSLLHLSHQMIASSSKALENTQDVRDKCGPEVSLTSGIVGTSPISDPLEKSLEIFTYSESDLKLKCYQEEASPSIPQSTESVPSECPVLSQEVSNNSGFVFPIADQIHDLKISLDDNVEQNHTDISAAKDSKNPETCQIKKTAEKKARKKKNAKSQLALELLRGFSITNQSEQPKPKFESVDANPHVLSEARMDIMKPRDFSSADIDDNYNNSSFNKTEDSQKSHLPPSEVKSLNKKAENIESGISELSSLRAWKSAPGIKAKSLKEIQQEEQLRVQMEMMASEIEIIPSTCSESVPWAGTVGSFDQKSKSDRDSAQTESSEIFFSKSDSNLNSKNRKSHLHDLLAEEVLAQSSEADSNLSRNSEGHLLPLFVSTVTVDASANDEDFVEAKDTKRSRKKASKAKVSGATNPSPVGSFDLSSSPLATEKRKNQNQTQNNSEMLPAPSLADFVSWKGETTNSSQLSAWPMDMGKFHKPTSLRDIQKEQESKLSEQQNIPISTPAKVQSNQGNRGSGTWQVPRSSSSSGTSPIQSSTLTSRQLKPKIEDDLFWDPVDQPKQQMEQHGFPSLRTSNWAGKSPARTNPIAINWQKSHSPSASSASRGKKDDEPSILSEAMGFRDWCEKELVRLTGTNDTSFLEYCLKQPTTETEMLLKENLGSLDRNHEFIDKFLSYKDLLSSKVIKMAFQANSSWPAPGTRNARAAALDFGVSDAEAGKGGKKKGKKGKKVSSAVLGFNVTSNRIMMGDIQAVDD